MPEKLTILHAITRLDRGGSSYNTLLSAIGMAERGHKVDILFGNTSAPSVRLLERARKAGVEFIEEEDLVRNIRPVKDIIAFWDIFHYLRRNHYDIVHAHSSKAGIICRFAAFFAGGSRIVYTPHGHVFYGYFGKLFTRMVIFLESLAALISDKIICLTPSEQEEWLDRGIGRREQYVSVHSGLEFDILEKEAKEGKDWRRELGIPDDFLLVGSAGRLTEIKGFDILIKAAGTVLKKRKDIMFILAGDGPLREKYVSMIREEGIEDHFRILGWQDKVGAVICALDIFVLTSLNEGMGRVLIEAMFFGKPVVATRVGGVPSVVSEDAGYLVPSRDPGAVAESVSILSEDLVRAARMGEQGRKRAISLYSASRMVDLLEDVYSGLCVRMTPEGADMVQDK